MAVTSIVKSVWLSVSLHCCACMCVCVCVHVCVCACMLARVCVRGVCVDVVQPVSARAGLLAPGEQDDPPGSPALAGSLTQCEDITWKRYLHVV